MNRLKQIQKFVEYNLAENFMIEPGTRFETVKEKIIDVTNTYKPEIIVKAGLGHGDLVTELARNTKSYLVVVEPSLSAIQSYVNAHKDDEDLQNIKFIAGDFHEFPIDYYACDLLICIDYLDFFDSSKSINEFIRAIKFEGIFFISTVILNDEDIDGIYDDFMKLIFPLHNDYYLANDITTFFKLYKLNPVKDIQVKFKDNLKIKMDHLQKIFDTVQSEKAHKFIESHNEEFKKFLELNPELDITEPYYFGVYMREKPEKIK